MDSPLRAPDPLPPGTGADVSTPAEPTIPNSVSRRGFLRGAALAGGGIVAATVAACAPAAVPAWEYATAKPASAGPSAAASAAASAPASATASAGATPGAPTPTPSVDLPKGWSEHDYNARQVVRRLLGALTPALKGIYDPVSPTIFTKLAEILGAADGDATLSAVPSFAQVQQLWIEDIVNPLKPTMEGDVKVFNLTVDEMQWRIDEMKDPVAALGYNKQWPGPTIRATEGDKVRINFTNNLKETTGTHFHGMDFESFFEDGVPFVTQLPILPGETYAYNFTAFPAGSMMYHSHHNATDQVGRGLLGAFIVEPKEGFEKRYGTSYDREYIWTSNDTLGGFTINGHGFPAVVPIVAAIGEKVLVRFMNEGIMSHPWHSHGYPMKVIARDGRPLGTASFECDTLSVAPGERWDAVITCDRAGVWAFHCHILPHVEGVDGMFGMVNVLLVVPTKADVDTVIGAVAKLYKPA